MLNESGYPVGVALAALALAVGPATAQEVVELPLEDRILDAEFPEVYRIGDGVRDWELLTRVTSIGFDDRGNLHGALRDGPAIRGWDRESRRL